MLIRVGIDLLMPAERLMFNVAVGGISDATFTWHVVLIRPSSRLVPIRVVVHATAFQLHAHKYTNQSIN